MAAMKYQLPAMLAVQSVKTVCTLASVMPSSSASSWPGVRLADVTVPVANPEAFIGWLLSFDDNAELIAPPELRQRLIDRVREGR